MKTLVAALLVLTIAGCSSEDTTKLGQDVKTIGQDATKSLSGLSLAGKVNTALDLRKDVDIKGLHIEAKDGVVTITGHVKSSDEKQRVFDVVNNTVGVEKVIDQSKIEP
jgi:hyperosmotically inducible protein